MSASAHCRGGAPEAPVVAVLVGLLLGAHAASAASAAATTMDVGKVLAGGASYDNHKVLRVTPATQTQVSTLGQLLEGGELDVWSKSRELNVPWDIMVGPLAAAEVRRTLEDNKMDWEVLIPDVGRALTATQKGSADIVSSRTADAAPSSGTTGSSPRYLRHAEVNEYLDDLARRFPDVVRVKSIGKSSEGRDLRLVHVSTGPRRKGGDGIGRRDARDAAKPKPAVWVDAGIHAREWIAPAVALHILNQLVENATHTADLTRDVDWYILPLVNPDGYEFTHTTDRLWRKTRSKSWWGLGCAGADANRNFDFHWREVGASWASCSYTYAGSKAFSEPEARAVRDFLLSHKDRVKMYLTYHSYGNFLLYPWGFTSTLPDDWKTLDSLARKANSAMVSAGSEPYTIGSSTNVLYAAAGGSDDWAKGVAGVQLSYTIELPGGNGHGFDLPASYIPEVGRHQMEAVKVFARHVAAME